MNKAQVLIAMAELFGESMTDSRLRAYLDVLSDLSQQELRDSVRALSQSEKVYKMPLPGQIYKAARPDLDTRGEAIRRLNLILHAVSKAGYMQQELAKEILGPVWNDVERMGGWKYICESPNCNLRNPTVYAQKRDEVQGMVESQRKGIEYAKVGSGRGAARISEITGRLAEMKKMT